MYTLTLGDHFHDKLRDQNEKAYCNNYYVSESALVKSIIKLLWHNLSGVNLNFVFVNTSTCSIVSFYIWK